MSLSGSRPNLDVLEWVVSGLGMKLSGVGFWTAILLPAVYLPLMLLNHPWMVDVGNVVKVLAVHAATLFVGRHHGGTPTRE